MRTDTPTPMHVDDAVEYFKSCADAFACLSGLHVADRFSSLADCWRRELKAGGLQR